MPITHDYGKWNVVVFVSFVVEWFFRIEDSFQAVHANEYDVAACGILELDEKKNEPHNLRHTHTKCIKFYAF